jgi:FixJ family two-component response regulator
LKPIEEFELLRTVDEALRLHAAGRADQDTRLSVAARMRKLTPRERDVFEGLVAGRLNKQIAMQLGIVEKTIKVHRMRMMRKLGATSVVDLVHLAGICGMRNLE